MPNLELGFHIHEKGFTGKSMRRGELIGHRDKKPKFTKRHFKEACIKIHEWMMEYNDRLYISEEISLGKCSKHPTAEEVELILKCKKTKEGSDGMGKR